MSTTPIPFLDLSEQYQSLKSEIFKKTDEIFSENGFTNGRSVREFEENFSRYCGTNYCIAVNSGTSALHLAMRALDIGIGDEVIVPANTFIATVWAILYVGATPVFIDCDANSWEINTDQIQNKITSKTKAIIGVHLYGQPCDLDKLQEIAKENNLYLVEDAAQAHGATFKNNKVGSIGQIGCFSFYPGKNLGTYGEGGALTTSDKLLAERLTTLRNHGSTERYKHTELGYNMRMGGMEAVVLNVKLKHLDVWNQARLRIAQIYKENITNVQIEFQQKIQETSSVYHLFVITHPKRDLLMNHLKNHQIFPGLHYPVPCHLQPALNHLNYNEGSMPRSEELANQCLSLPMFPELTEEKVNRVVEVINQF